MPKRDEKKEIIMPNMKIIPKDRLNRIMTAKKFKEYLKRALEARFGRRNT